MSAGPARRPRIRCVAMRGGTTRGFFFRVEDLPRGTRARDELLLSLIAGADGQGADGMGGGDLLLSKVALIAPPSHPDHHLDAVYGAITPGSARIKYGSNCGNLSAAVGLLAVEEGLVDPSGLPVRIYNPDSGGVVEARPLVTRPDDDAGPGKRDGSGPALHGPTTGTPIELAFVRPTGTLGSGLLPTGRPVDRLYIDGQPVDVSVVDASAVYCFVPSRAVGLERAALPAGSERSRALLRFADRVRRRVAVLIGVAPSEELADAVSPNVPKIAFVSPSDTCCTHLLACIVSSQSLHRAYAVTGAIATGAASVVEETVVARIVGPRPEGRATLRIGHPGGVIEPSIDWHHSDGGVVVERAYLLRTARTLMTGELHPPCAATVFAGGRPIYRTIDGDPSRAYTRSTTRATSTHASADES